MKTLTIECTKIGNSKIVLLIDSETNTKNYIFTSEYNYHLWVLEQANSFKANGYTILNNTNINL